MPTPYFLLYTSTLATYGTNGATPSQAFISTLVARNIAPITLTGSFQNVASIGPFNVSSGLFKVVVSGQVAADNATPSSSGQIQLEIVEDGVVIGTPVIQSFPTDGTGATLNWEIERIPGAGAHTYTVRALATGDATGTVQVGHAQIIAQTTSG